MLIPYIFIHAHIIIMCCYTPVCHNERIEDRPNFNAADITTDGFIILFKSNLKIRFVPVRPFGVCVTHAV